MYKQRHKPAFAAQLADDGSGGRRLRYEYAVVLRVRVASWKDAVLSRFLSDDRKMQEGKEFSELVLMRLREAGLTLKVRKHVASNGRHEGSKLLMVFVTASTKRLEAEQQRLSIERWLQEEGIGSHMTQRNGHEARAPPRPTMRVVRVGGLHYFAPTSPAANGGAPAAAPAEEPAKSDFTESAAGRIVLLEHILHSPVAQGGAGLRGMQKDDRRGVILSVRLDETAPTAERSAAQLSPPPSTAQRRPAQPSAVQRSSAHHRLPHMAGAAAARPALQRGAARARVT